MLPTPGTLVALLLVLQASESKMKMPVSTLTGGGGVQGWTPRLRGGRPCHRSACLITFIKMCQGLQPLLQTLILLLLFIYYAETCSQRGEEERR